MIAGYLLDVFKTFNVVFYFFTLALAMTFVFASHDGGASPDDRRGGRVTMPPFSVTCPRPEAWGGPPSCATFLFHPKKPLLVDNHEPN